MYASRKTRFFQHRPVRLTLKTTLDLSIPLPAQSIEQVRTSIKDSGLRLSVIGCHQPNHIATVRRSAPAAMSNLCVRSNWPARWAFRTSGSVSGKIPGRALAQQVDEIVRVYNEKYFPPAKSIVSVYFGKIGSAAVNHLPQAVRRLQSHQGVRAPPNVGLSRHRIRPGPGGLARRPNFPKVYGTMLLAGGEILLVITRTISSTCWASALPGNLPAPRPTCGKRQRAGQFDRTHKLLIARARSAGIGSDVVGLMAADYRKSKARIFDAGPHLLDALRRKRMLRSRVVFK